MNRYSRLARIINQDQILKLQKSTVMIVGIGGVGAMACEILARSAVGTLIIVDNDVIQLTNINRQIHATDKTINLSKTDVMAERINDIDPNCKVVKYDCFFNKESEYLFDQHIDYVIDAIDTISAKLDLIEICHKKAIPIISCMGMGNRLDPTQVIYTELNKTEGDPLAKAMRIQARKRMIDYTINVVFSVERPKSLDKPFDEKDNKNGKVPPGSSAFVPNTAGIFLASYVVRKLIERVD